MLRLVFPASYGGLVVRAANLTSGEEYTPRIEKTVIGLRTLVALLVVSLQLCCRAFDKGG
jgi:hypothetical protein